MPRPSKKAVDEKPKAMPIVPTVVSAPTMVPASIAGGIHHPLPVPVAPGVPQRVVDNDSFLRVRDSAVGRLTTIMELIRSFTNDYIRQTNLLLGEPTAEGPQDLMSAFDSAAAQLIMPLGDMAPMAEAKKERKKRTHDPNAPKRPLTPHFLYMQHARSIIANDLGAEAPKGAVQEEGQRRWAHMGPQEKQGWNNAYQYNLRLYNARVHSYKHGNPLAKNMSDEEALKYAEDFNIPMPELKEPAVQVEAATNDQDAIAQQLQQAVVAPSDEEEEEEEEEDEVEAPLKTPKKSAAAAAAASSRKRKTATPVTEVELPKVVAAAASPDKKRRRTSKAAEAEKEEPKKSGRKKTKSS